MSFADQFTSIQGPPTDWRGSQADDIDVMIVDDDAGVRRSLRSLLEVEGIAARTYATGRDFLAAYNPARGGCLILDAELPDLQGLEVQRQVAAKNANLPVIMITGHSDASLVKKAFKAGAFDFIEKPYKTSVILKSIRNALSHSQRTKGQAALAQVYQGGVERLTRRERRVLQLLLSGLPNKVIARQLGISHRTVEVHRARIMGKMQAENLIQIMRMAAAVGFNELWEGHER